MIYLILTPGRTGSHYLKEIMRGYLLNSKKSVIRIEKSWDSRFHNIPEFSQFQNYIIHSHDKKSLTIAQPFDITLILSKRKNIFETVLSNEVAKKTKTSPGTPFTVDPRIYAKAYFFILSWFNDIDLTSNYHSVKEIYYEDMIEYGIDHVGNVLEFSYCFQKTEELPEKTPHNYKDLVINWKELYSLNEKLIELGPTSNNFTAKNVIGKF